MLNCVDYAGGGGGIWDHTFNPGCMKHHHQLRTVPLQMACMTSVPSFASGCVIFCLLTNCCVNGPSKHRATFTFAWVIRIQNEKRGSDLLVNLAFVCKGQQDVSRTTKDNKQEEPLGRNLYSTTDEPLLL